MEMELKPGALKIRNDSNQRSRLDRWVRICIPLTLLSLLLSLVDSAVSQNAQSVNEPQLTQENPTAQANRETDSDKNTEPTAQAEPLALENETPAAPEFESAGLSGLDRPKRAKWQQKLTLGPGDTVHLRHYGYPSHDRADVAIGPDGRLSYLQIQDLQAAGLTIDELREKLSEELAYYYRNALVIVTPGRFQSKRYVVLGKVSNKGVYILDRPTTVLEAVARARGLETGLFEGNTVELADMSRSFLARGNQRVPVNFENLFYRGDLSQNALLEPGDFLYFPSAIANEVYILGEVPGPGPVGYRQNATVLSMITVRGGFTNRAFRKRVLVVRGSLSEPQTFVVNVDDILAGRAIDFPVQPKDIIFVAQRPWIRVEELLDLAVSAYVQAATTSWTGQNIGPLIEEPFIPGIR